MERAQKVRQAGYIHPNRLQEIIRDALRTYSKNEKLAAGKMILREVAGWASYSSEEALGLLDSAKFKFLQDAEDNLERKEKRNSKSK